MKRKLNILPIGSLSILFVFAALISSCQTSKPWEGLEPDDIPSLMRQEFEIDSGMSRDSVERVMGKPAQVGRTKEGYSFAQYEDGYNVRSVVYDYDGYVIEAYPY